MLMARDGSSKQRGHGRLPEDFPVAEEVLMPSGSAALYRRAMLEEIGGFDDDFFLYCEDTDLGLRARWAGWKCLYVPEAVVEHHYSHSAGRASPVKAYYVERNRLFVLVKNFPGAHAAGGAVRRAGALLLACLVHSARAGAAPRAFARKGNAGPKMVWYVVRAHAALLGNLGRAVAAAPRNPRAGAHHAGDLPAPAAQPLDQRQKDGRALIRPAAPDSLLIIVPAFNEEGAIARRGRARSTSSCRACPCW